MPGPQDAPLTAPSDAPGLAWRGFAAIGLALLALWMVQLAAVRGLVAPAWMPLLGALGFVAIAGSLGSPGWSAKTRAAALVAAIALLAGTLNLRAMTAPDTQPASQQPWTLLRHGTIFLDAAPVVVEHPDAHWLYRAPDGRRASWYPPGTALLSTPLYVPALFAANPSSALLSAFEKSAAGMLSALTVLLLGLALARAGSNAREILFAGLLYALGTSALSLLSQALWQQTSCALAVALALFASLAPEEKSSRFAAVLAGFILAASRLPDVLLLLPLLWAARSPRLALWSGLGLALGLGAFCADNLVVFGRATAIGYQIGQHHLGFTLGELPESLVGLFLSPGHGLLVFCPWLLVLPACLRLRERTVAASMASALTLVCVMSCWWCWWGADAFGPRMLSEVQVLLVFALARGAPDLAPRGRALLLGLALIATLTHAAYPFWLARDPTFNPNGPWRLAGHPLGHALLPD